MQCLRSTAHAAVPVPHGMGRSIVASLPVPRYAKSGVGASLRVTYCPGFGVSVAILMPGLHGIGKRKIKYCNMISFTVNILNLVMGAENLPQINLLSQQNLSNRLAPGLSCAKDTKQCRQIACLPNFIFTASEIFPYGGVGEENECQAARTKIDMMSTERTCTGHAQDMHSSCQSSDDKLD